jgi:anaerobic selenocysteine-containing dehydrogenase
MLGVLDGLPVGVADDLRAGKMPTPPAGARPVQFVDVFPRTSDRKVHLFDDALEREAPLGLYTFQPDPGTDDYPLALISPASDRTISSTLGELSRPTCASTCIRRMPRRAALTRAIRARVQRAGRNDVPGARDVHVRPGTVAYPKGVWRRHVPGGWTSNALVPDTLTDLGGGACFNDARVQVGAGPEGP